MTVPNALDEIKYKGSGIDKEQFYFPFTVRDTSVLYVYTIDSAGVETAKVLDTDYSVVLSETGEQGDGEGDFGLVTWIGTSPTDTVWIFRREEPKQSNTFTGTIDSDKVEQSANRIAESLTMSLNRDDEDPSTFGAGDKKLINSGQPVRGSDGVTKKNLDLTSADAGLDVPATATTGFLLTPNDMLPSTPSVEWSEKFDYPALPAEPTDLLESTGTGDSFQWSTHRWVPLPDGLGTDEFLTEITKDKMDWRQVWEVPDPGSLLGQAPSTLAEIDSVVGVDIQDNIIWQPVIETTELTDAQADDRFIIQDSTGVNHGRRYVYGTESLTKTSTTSTDKHTDTVSTFSIAHGLVDDTGASAKPDMVWLQVECPTVNTDDYPVFTAYLNNLDEQHDGDPLGISATRLEGKIVMWNANEYGTAAALTWTGNATVKLHWMVSSK